MLGGQEAAAAVAEVSTSTFSSWVNGKADPSFEGLWRLAKAAGVSLDWLATGEGPKAYVPADETAPGWQYDDPGPMTPEKRRFLEERGVRFEQDPGVEDADALAYIAALVIGYCRKMEPAPSLDTQARIIVDSYDKALKSGGRAGMSPGAIIQLLESLGEITPAGDDS